MAYLLIKGKKEGGTRDFSLILVSILQDYPSNIINHEVMPYISVIYVATVYEALLGPALAILDTMPLLYIPGKGVRFYAVMRRPKPLPNGTRSMRAGREIMARGDPL